ncbi:MAG TPA: dihydroorotate dehydrogenase [Ignavibacteriales bacterium]|nr:dihydroorotate dehydrogenase [Ignavibacteriales bacterium]HOL81104.1 dihydroorotate dehydrogenase [Ignavibacteriales bacterium]HOM65208.1 dihydroorotate dehydrogenase [Ignavibacteriales bacterium]HPD66500.1 dihydroorotate dehydrogenase [Ignavibacteriales bacterium]HPP33540.1 dihydroorotate dehydrogenase [Ignavibacteriales bacterium]
MEFLGIKVSSPLVLASGILGISYSSLQRVVKDGCGIVTTKSIALKERTGHEGPIWAEIPGGMMNAVGLAGPGIEIGIQEVEEFKAVSSAPIIISVFGGSVEDFKKLSEYVNTSKADFIELNLSCPNVADEFERPFAHDENRVFEVVKAVKSISKIPVIAKLSPNVTDIKPIAKAAENAGADALTLINTVGPGLLIDPIACKPVLKNTFGGISGPCIKPIALKIVYEVYKTVKIPIIGTGGVTTGLDAIEMMMAGATMVGVGSAVYYRGQNVFKKILNEMNKFIKENNFKSFEELIGKIHNGQKVYCPN